VSKPVTTKKVLLISFLVDLLDVTVNLVITVITGSTVMLAETLQGMADLTSVGMLLIGFRNSKRRSTSQHPFGYGKEQYFWALISIFLIIAVTSTLSFYSGIHRWLHAESIKYIWIAYAALAVAIISNGYAAALSLRKIIGRQDISRLPKEFAESSDITPRITLVLDAAGSLAAIFGLISLILYGITGNSKFDALGAMAIGIILFAMAIVLLATTKSLITGKSASNKTKRNITTAALRIPQVNDVLGLRTMMMGSDNLLINIKVHLKDDMSTDEIEKVIDDIKANIQKDLNGRAHISVEPETPPKSRLKNLT
jgi:cation diffusion facilitator family transporter